LYLVEEFDYFQNDIVTVIKASIKLFADDTSFYVTVDTPQNAADIINRDLEKIHQWSVNWLVKFNPPKTETMVSCSFALELLDFIDQIVSLRIPNNIPIFQNGSNEREVHLF
jgi:hypothetical protein